MGAKKPVNMASSPDDVKNVKTKDQPKTKKDTQKKNQPEAESAENAKTEKTPAVWIETGPIVKSTGYIKLMLVYHFFLKFTQGNFVNFEWQNQTKYK